MKPTAAPSENQLSRDLVTMTRWVGDQRDESQFDSVAEAVSVAQQQIHGRTVVGFQSIGEPPFGMADGDRWIERDAYDAMRHAPSLNPIALVQATNRDYLSLNDFSGDHAAHKVATESVALLGRGEVLEAVLEQLEERPTVVITGPAGAGKTAVLEALEALLKGRAERVFLVDLQPFPPGSPIASITVRAVAIGPSAKPVNEGLADFLLAEPTTLIFDHADSHLAAITELVSELCASVPGLRIVVAARTPWRNPGAVVISLPPLKVPANSEPFDVIQASPAVQLFCRTSRVSPNACSDADLRVIAALCDEVDGNPGAICALARSLDGNLESLLDQLVRARLIEARHPVDRATRLTVGLLSDDARALVDVLALSTGQLCYDEVASLSSHFGLNESRVWPAFSELIDHGMLLSEGQAPHIRSYRLVHSVRAAVQTRPTVLGGGEKFAEWLRIYLEPLGVRGSSGDMTAFDPLERRLWDALRVIEEHHSDAFRCEETASLVNSLFPLLFFRKYFDEGEAAYSQVEKVAEAMSVSTRLTFFCRKAYLSVCAGNFQNARSSLIKALGIARHTRDDLHLTRIGSVIGEYYRTQAYTKRTVKWYRRVGEGYERAGQLRNAAFAFTTLISAADDLNNDELAAWAYEKAKGIYESLKDPILLNMIAANSGLMLLKRNAPGDRKLAIEYARVWFKHAADNRSLPEFMRVGLQVGTLCYYLDRFAAATAVLGHTKAIDDAGIAHLYETDRIQLIRLLDSLGEEQAEVVSPDVEEYRELIARTLDQLW